MVVEHDGWASGQRIGAAPWRPPANIRLVKAPARAATAAANPGEHVARTAPERSYAEILQEIRVAQGVAQAVVAFQLGLGFTSRFSLTEPTQRMLYVIMLMLSVTAIALLVTPIVYRQLTFRHHREPKMAVANRCVLAGLTMLMCSVVASLLFALYVVCGVALALAVAIATFVWFVMWWFVYPMWARGRYADCPES
ncbi:DUF6328 family protein [Nocardia sp. NPDC005998]|uniref:DUF6328 family protein n=1 Tax=Nocardia sp. NPDC005998 TaxID=3156894 RepID=UPI0033B1548A